MEKRFDIPVERFLKIWKSPEVEIGENEQNNEVNLFDADDPTNRKLEYVVFLYQKLDIQNFSDLYKEVLKRLFDKNPETFFTTDLSEKLSLKKNTQRENSGFLCL